MKPKLYTVLLISIFFAFISCTKIQDEKAGLGSSGKSFATSTQKTNVILILADDVGYEVPTCNGGQSYSTPNLDYLAQTGVRYVNCFSMPTCSPSRIELLTGKYNFRNYRTWSILDTSQRTLGNLMKQAGYATCVAGKWQLDGGAVSAQKFGFDTHCLFFPLSSQNEVVENQYRYKNPHIYLNGAFLPDSATNGKYADDMFTKFICNFIDSNKQKPFFVYYPVSLCHQPFAPSPNHPDYANWKPGVSKSNKIYYPDMVNYMDQKIGEIINKVQEAGVASNTIIIFTSDNGTPKEISSQWNGITINGSKGTSKLYGIHVPLIVTNLGNPGRAGAVANTLVDFSDFMPTLASIANTQVSPEYGKVDGVSFYNSIMGTQDSIRSAVFFHWEDSVFKDYYRWAQTGTYKLYDETNANKFFNFVQDPNELTSIPGTQRTTQQKSTAKMLKAVLDSLKP